MGMTELARKNAAFFAVVFAIFVAALALVVATVALIARF